MDSKLDILINAKMIDLSDKDLINNSLEILEVTYGDHNNEVFDRLQMHLAMMINRQRNNQSIDKMPENIWEMIMEDNLYIEASHLFEKMEKILDIPINERAYVILHLCNYLKEVK
ncbi:MAG: PRD domain-containing protein [Erysipelotrichaceae bacterium]